ncbi:MULTISPECIES: ribonuclease E/G [Helcococcus]|uniref:Ribonuclease E/G n=1 Tax=Helcococcus bovis TaxID=3153252 RepID=A0ABW9F6R4_9FIRM
MDNFKFIFDDEKLICGEVKNNRLIDYIDVKKNIIGNIYRARIIDYLNSMDAYVLNIGEEKNALLRKKYLIDKVKLGDDVLVEVIKVPEDDKMIEVSQKISLSDGYVILMPYIKNNIKNIIYEFEIPYKLRSRGKLISNEELEGRYCKLVNDYKKLLKEKHMLPTPKLIYQGKFLRDYFIDYDMDVISNKKNEYANLVDKNFNPKYNEIISLDLANSRDRKVQSDEIEIVIDRLEALTVIDINSKYSNHALDKEKLSLEVNMKSIEEIAIQIKLRNIKKMLIIDFLRMNADNKLKLKNKIKDVFQEYGLQYKIMGFSNMDLFEIIVF